MHDAVQAFRYINLVAYIALGAVALVFWRRRRDRASMWAAIAFGSLGLLELLTPRSRTTPGTSPERAVGRVAIALLVALPVPPLPLHERVPRRRARRLANALFGLTRGPRRLDVRAAARSRSRASPRRRRSRRSSSSSSSTGRCSRSSPPSSLWRAGRAQPTVARRRMQLPRVRDRACSRVALLARRLHDERRTRRCSLASRRARRRQRRRVPPRLRAAAAPPPLVARAGAGAPAGGDREPAHASRSRRRRSPSRVLEPAAAIVGARAIAIRNAEGKRRRRLERPGRRVGEPRARQRRRARRDARARRPRGARRQPRRLDVAVRAVLRRRGARACSHARRADRPRARPRPPLPGRARGAARARARERGEDELHRARRTRAAHADDDDPRLRDDAAPPRRPARRRAARDRCATRCSSRRSAWRGSSSSCSTSRGSTPRRSTSRRSASTCARRSRRSSRTTAADRGAVEIDVPDDTVAVVDRNVARPHRDEPRHERLPLRRRRP